MHLIRASFSATWSKQLTKRKGRLRKAKWPAHLKSNNIYIDPPGSGLDSRLTVDRKIHQRPVTSFIFFDNVNSLLLCVSLLYFVPLLLTVWSASSKEKKWEAKRRIGKKEMVAVLILFIVACLWRWCVYVIPYNNKDNNSSFFGAIVTLISRSGSCPAVALTRNCRTTRSVIRHSQERRCQKRQTRRLQGKNQGKWKEIDSFFISEIIIIIINNHNNKKRRNWRSGFVLWPRRTFNWMTSTF